jgi:hypothetical protein
LLLDLMIQGTSSSLEGDIYSSLYLFSEPSINV